jgi:hypothetical protein
MKSGSPIPENILFIALSTLGKTNKFFEFTQIEKTNPKMMWS